MKIKMLTSLAGDDFALAPGDETDRFGADEAQRLVEAGYAAPAVADKVERATKNPAPEKR